MKQFWQAYEQKIKKWYLAQKQPTDLIISAKNITQIKLLTISTPNHISDKPMMGLAKHFFFVNKNKVKEIYVGIKMQQELKF